MTEAVSSQPSPQQNILYYPPPFLLPDPKAVELKLSHFLGHHNRPKEGLLTQVEPIIYLSVLTTVLRWRGEHRIETETKKVPRPHQLGHKRQVFIHSRVSHVDQGEPYTEFSCNRLKQSLSSSDEILQGSGPKSCWQLKGCYFFFFLMREREQFGYINQQFPPTFGHGQFKLGFSHLQPKEFCLKFPSICVPKSYPLPIPLGASIHTCTCIQLPFLFTKICHHFYFSDFFCLP